MTNINMTLKVFGLPNEDEHLTVYLFKRCLFVLGEAYIIYVDIKEMQTFENVIFEKMCFFLPAS